MHTGVASRGGSRVVLMTQQPRAVLLGDSGDALLIRRTVVHDGDGNGTAECIEAGIQTSGVVVHRNDNLHRRRSDSRRDGVRDPGVEQSPRQNCIGMIGDRMPVEQPGGNAGATVGQSQHPAWRPTDDDAAGVMTLRSGVSLQAEADRHGLGHWLGIWPRHSSRTASASDTPGRPSAAE